uniref:Uncharacterized protein n=1 Tax=Pipistrellus kuhlii TaxID=59472 RepID=A0A7J7RCN5_PIPKU|nr:hypothetical protein mPipKuh1_010694 [Pipistrellus kuhlii]
MCPGGLWCIAHSSDQGVRGGEGGHRGGEEQKAAGTDFAKCPQGRVYSKPRPGREDKGGGRSRTGEGRRPSNAAGQRRVGDTDELGSPRRIPAAQAGFGIPLQARCVQLLGSHVDRRGRGVWGGESPTPFE